MRAADNLRYIRETMENAVCFTAVSGFGEIAVGLSALAAAYFASRQTSPQAWLFCWLGEALFAFALTSVAIVWKARKARVSLLSRPGRRFALGLLPPLLAGALLTAVLFQAGT